MFRYYSSIVGRPQNNISKWFDTCFSGNLHLTHKWTQKIHNNRNIGILVNTKEQTCVKLQFGWGGGRAVREGKGCCLSGGFCFIVDHLQKTKSNSSKNIGENIQIYWNVAFFLLGTTFYSLVGECWPCKIISFVNLSQSMKSFSQHEYFFMYKICLSSHNCEIHPCSGAQNKSKPGCKAIISITEYINNFWSMDWNTGLHFLREML